MKEMPLPHSVEAEECTLASLLIDPEAIVKVIEFLQADMFTSDARSSLYEVIAYLYHKREVADFITVEEELARRGKLADVGGSLAIGKLLNRLPTSAHVENYAKVVERAAQHRRLIHAAGEIAGRAYHQDDDALSFAEETIYQISMRTVAKPIASHRDALVRYIDKLSALHERSKNGLITGVPTGFKFLDKKLGGLRPSDLIILAARPAVGKTSFALNIADHAVRAGYQILFFSMEMAEEQIMQRWMAMEAGIDQSKLRDARLTQEEWDRLIDAGARIDALPGCLWIEDSCGLSSTQIRSKARRKQMESGVDMIIVDYLQLGKAPNESGQRYENRRIEVEEVCRSLKHLARELNIPVFSLAQLSREVERRQGKVPELSDLREAGGIEADADVVMFLHVDPEISKEEKEYPINVIVEKHRNGARGIVPLRFFATETRYETITMEVQP